MRNRLGGLTRFQRGISMRWLSDGPDRVGDAIEASGGECSGGYADGHPICWYDHNPLTLVTCWGIDRCVVDALVFGCMVIAWGNHPTDQLNP
jgi:energy-converting hydrogenase Eha subunit B